MASDAKMSEEYKETEANRYVVARIRADHFSLAFVYACLQSLFRGRGRERVGGDRRCDASRTLEATGAQHLQSVGSG